MPAPQYTNLAQDRANDMAAWVRAIVTVVNNILFGRVNWTVDVTIPTSVIAHTVTDARCHSYSSVLLDPMTESARAALAAGTVYILAAGRRQGEFEITCDASDLTDRTFRCVILG